MGTVRSAIIVVLFAAMVFGAIFAGIEIGSLRPDLPKTGLVSRIFILASGLSFLAGLLLRLQFVRPGFVWGHSALGSLLFGLSLLLFGLRRQFQLDPSVVDAAGTVAFIASLIIQRRARRALRTTRALAGSTLVAGRPRHVLKSGA